VIERLPRPRVSSAHARRGIAPRDVGRVVFVGGRPHAGGARYFEELFGIRPNGRGPDGVAVRRQAPPIQEPGVARGEAQCGGIVEDADA